MALPTTVSGTFNLSAAVHSITLMRDLSFICLIQHWFSFFLNQCRYGWVAFDRTIQTDQDCRDTRDEYHLQCALLSLSSRPKFWDSSKWITLRAATTWSCWVGVAFLLNHHKATKRWLWRLVSLVGRYERLRQPKPSAHCATLSWTISLQPSTAVCRSSLQCTQEFFQDDNRELRKQGPGSNAVVHVENWSIWLQNWVVFWFVWLLAITSRPYILGLFWVLAITASAAAPKALGSPWIGVWEVA